MGGEGRGGEGRGGDYQRSCCPPHLSLPHEPYFEGIIDPAALDGLVAHVKGNIIVYLVRHEQVAGLGGVAGSQEPMLSGQES